MHAEQHLSGELQAQHECARRPDPTSPVPHRRNGESFMSLACLLHDAAVRFPNKFGVIIDNRILSYSALNIEAQRLAHKLVGSSVRPGGRVALHIYNGPELVVSYFACFIAGAIAVSVNTG
jgi:acyl-CoA synthetase (AMP-forming)/AMP-acid ligase II